MVKTSADQRKRALIYLRISNDPNGQTYGVQRQEQDCRKLADLLKLEVIDCYCDNDISAFSGKVRPDFQRLLHDIEAERGDVVICWHTDRLYRGLKDLTRLFEVGPNLLIKTVQGTDLDFRTSSGKMLAGILGSVQAQESEHHSERRLRACVQKAALGVWETSNRPFGYTLAGQPYEPEASAVRKAVADVLDGTSIQAVARQWNSAGLTTTKAGVVYKRGGKEYEASGKWSGPKVRRVLLSPRIAGLKVHQGKVVEKDVGGKRVRLTGNWTPLIELRDHDRIVAHLTDPTRVTTTSWERTWQGAGIYRCGVCDGPMKSNRSGRADRQRRNYVCRRRGCVARDAQHLDDHVANTVLEYLEGQNLVIADRRDDAVGQLQNERAGWVAKLDKLVDLLDVLDGPTARQRATEYKAEIAKCDRQLAAALSESPAAKMRACGQDLRVRWDEMDATLRGQVIDELVVVKVLPAKRGRGFDYASVDISWR